MRPKKMQRVASLLATIFGKLLLSAAISAVLLHSAESQAASRDEVTLNFVNAEIDAVVKVMSEVTGRHFVLDPRVKGVVSVISSKPINKASAYQVFLSALRAQGYTVVESGNAYRIVPEADAKFNATPTIGTERQNSQPSERLVTQVFQLRNESAAQVVPAIRPLVGPNNAVTAVPGNNTIVITDYADNLRRIARIIESIDQASSGDPVSVQLEHASAADLAYTLGRLLADGPMPAGAPPDVSQRVTIVPDLRTNSLIIRGESVARVARVRTLIASLDRPSTGGDLQVVYLKNAEASKIAESLRAMYGGSPVASVAAAGTSSAPVTSTQSTAPPVTIHADLSNNALVIKAPGPVYNQLRAVIEKLDTRRAQIFVEALIVEVSSDNAAEFGIQWQSLSGLGDTDRRAFGGTNFGGSGQNIQGITQNPLSAGGGLSIGIVRGAVTIPGVGTVTNLGLLARALERGAKANILSTPNLLTMDNEEAKIVIGQNVPFITGQYAQTGAATGTTVTPTPFQTIERRDIGLTLRIRPQIAEGGNIKLKIYQEVSSVQDRTNAAGIITNKRSIDSVVEIEDGLIVALGGLLEDKFDTGIEQVPGLGSIPVIGNLFKYETRRQVKTNLMVFLRPVILREPRNADSITVDRYRSLMNEQQRVQPPSGGILPDLKSPNLPALKSQVPNPTDPAAAVKP